MPKLNRRRFLQAASAAGLAPMVPAFPVGTAAASPVTSAQMLWASLFARAGNAKSAAGLASAMNIPLKSAQGIYAKVLEANVVAAHGVTRLGQATQARPVMPKASPVSQPTKSHSLNANLEKLIGEQTDELSEKDAPEMPEVETDEA